MKGGRKMLVFDFRLIGNRLLKIRKKCGMTQSEVAEMAGLSDRTYADIERGSVNMRIETVLKICKALQITPDAILTTENPSFETQKGVILKQFEECSLEQQETALQLLAVYFHSLKK